MTNLEIIKRLKTAKDLYDKDTKPGSDKNGGMCHYMKQAFNGVFKEGIPPSYNELVALIPEFNPEFLGGNVKQEEVARLVFWWPVDEKKHRLVAFDKLIHCATAISWCLTTIILLLMRDRWPCQRPKCIFQGSSSRSILRNNKSPSLDSTFKNLC